MLISLDKGIELAFNHLEEPVVHGNQINAICPFCKSTKKKFYMNKTTGLFDCKSGKCQSKGHINTLLEKLGVEDRVEFKGEMEKQEKKRIYIDISKFQDIKEDDEIVDYMASRGIAYETLLATNCMKKGNALAMPTYRDKELVGICYRTPDKRIWQEAGSGQYLWNRGNLDKDIKRIYITEGRVDCLTLIEMGYKNCVSMPNGCSSLEWINQEWNLLQEFEEIVLLYDNDNPGKTGLEQAKGRLDFATLYTVNLGKYKDINEAYMEDSSFLYRAMNNAKELQLDGFISLDSVSTSDGVGAELYSCGIPQFDRIFGGIRLGESTIICASSGTGKSLPLTSRLYTKNGYILMKDVKIGDEIFGEDGKLHKVVGVFPQGKKQKVRITFSDNTFADCCEDHLWSVYELSRKPKSRARKLAPQEIDDKWPTTTMSVKEMIEKGWLRRGYDKKQNRPMFTSKFHIPITKPVEFEAKEHYIDPYLLGILIGDGYLSGSSLTFSTSEEYIYKTVDSILSEIGYEVRRKAGDGYRYRIANTLQNTPNKLKQEIHRLGLNIKAHEKFIPNEYKFDSVENRLSLLRGIFDTDGCVKGARTVITTISPKLKEDIIWLCQSLGMTATVSEDARDKYTGNDRCYNISIQFNDGFEPFTSPKHTSRYTKPKRKQFVRRYIKNIEYLDEYVEMQCISIDNPTKLYLTDNFIVTHNTVVLCNFIKGILSQDEKVGIFSGELTNASIKAWIYSVVGGTQAVNLKEHPFRKGEFVTSIKKEYEDQIDKTVKNRLWIYDGGQSNAYTMLSNFSALNKRFGVKYFFIDNLSILNMSVKGMGQYEAEEHFAKCLAEFCKKHKCHVFLFAHPTKQNLNTDADFIDRAGRVKPIQRYDQYSVRGSATLVNLSHNIMFLMRAKEHERQFFIQHMRDTYSKLNQSAVFNNEILPLLKDEFSLFAYLAKNRGSGKTFEDALFGYDANTRRIYGLLTKSEDLSREVELEEEDIDDTEDDSFTIDYNEL